MLEVPDYVEEALEDASRNDLEKVRNLLRRSKWSAFETGPPNLCRALGKWLDREWVFEHEDAGE